MSAIKLSFFIQPSNTPTGTSILPTISVRALDSFDGVDPTYTGEITLAISNNPSSGILNGVVTQTAIEGVASFPGLSINNVGDGYSLVATAAGLTSDISDTFNIFFPIFSGATPRIDLVEAQITDLYLTGGGGSGGGSGGGFDAVAPFASLNTLPRVEGKIYYATDQDIVYTDNGVILSPLISFSGKTTTDLPEGSNLYFNQTRVTNTPAVLANTAKVGLSSRVVVSGTTSVINSGVKVDLNITGFKSYLIYKIATSHPAWVTVYTSGATRLADAVRDQFTDPFPGTGVIGEVVTSGEQTVTITPGSIGFDDAGGDTIYLSVTNLDMLSQAITVTLTVLRLEV